LETWLWDAACAIRGAADAPKFKDFILPLVFFKRLSDVFDDEFFGQVAEFGDEEVAREVIKADHEDALKNNRKPIVRFFIPHEYRWDAVRHHAAEGTLGQFVTDAMRDVAKHNPELLGVLDIKDYNERQSGQRTLDDDRLAALIEVISRHRLGLKNAEPDILGRAYEYLLRKFAEGQGQSAGEFYTPKEVGWLMAHLLDPKPYTTVYDPTCGSAGLLIKARLLFEQKNPAQKSKAPKLYGQEMNPVTFAMAKMNMFLHDYTDSLFAIGDTFKKPGFAAEGAGLKRFDYVMANPMWNDDNYDDSLYEGDQWQRFERGYPLYRSHPITCTRVQVLWFRTTVAGTEVATRFRSTKLSASGLILGTTGRSRVPWHEHLHAPEFEQRTRCSRSTLVSGACSASLTALVDIGTVKNIGPFWKRPFSRRTPDRWRNAC
jgi:type I restriction enzyme M protein